MMKQSIESVLNTDAYDRRRFGQLVDMSEGLQRLQKQGVERFPSFPSLMSDLWASLFKMNPTLQETVPNEIQMNHQLMQQVLNEETHRDFREHTRLDEFASVLGVTTYSKAMLNWIDEQVDKNQELAHVLQKLSDGDSDVDQEATDAFSQALEQEGNSLSQKFFNANKETIEAMESMQFLLGGLEPGNGKGDLQKIPLQDKLILAEKLSHYPKLREIAEWAGRMKIVANRKQRSPHKDAINRSGVRPGNQIEHLLPAELGNYASSSPLRKLDFLRRYVEGQTFQYDNKSRKPLGKGPIILCLDQSNSMRKQDALSKGFALALMSIARKQRRDFAWIPFSSEAAMPMIYDRGRMSVADTIDLAQTFLGGGTNFQSPLYQAEKVLVESRLKGADVIFVTDGQSRVSEAFLDRWNALKKRKGYSVLTLLLGNEVSYGVELFSDQIVKASSWKDEVVYTLFDF